MPAYKVTTWRPQPNTGTQQGPKRYPSNDYRTFTGRWALEEAQRYAQAAVETGPWHTASIEEVAAVQ